MIETGSIVELSNNKKYIITDSSIENNSIFYMALEVDYNTEKPLEKSMFFQHKDDTLIPVTAEGDIEFLKTIFVDKFLKEVMNEEDEESE